MPREVSFHVPSVAIIRGSRLPAKSLKLPKTKKLSNFDEKVLSICGSWECYVLTYRCM